MKGEKYYNLFLMLWALLIFARGVRQPRASSFSSFLCPVADRTSVEDIRRCMSGHGPGPVQMTRCESAATALRGVLFRTT
jgi:hypothetical protein